ncbi:MAG: serine protease [Pseudomonadota bacterium]
MNQKHPISATPRRNILALALIATVAVGGPVAARQLKGPKASPEDNGRTVSSVPTNVPAARVRVDARGNWMREYVQLRVAERNLRALEEAGVTEADLRAAIPTKIVGGTVAGSTDNRFQVALLTKSVANNFDAQFCGGTLVKANVIVTAAHCSDFVTASQVQVLTGTRNLDGTGVRRNVTKIAIHPSWNPGTFDYDVAVWTLSSSTSGIPFASLASTTPATGTNLLVTGWGALTEGGSFPINLRKVTVPVVSTTNCNDANSYNGQITARMVCAGFDAGGKDSCQGDSGGPLAQGSVLTGIVSWGDGCARPNKHGIYTRVSNSSVRSFIVTQAGL